ncbi:TM1802 family CRISPR-associated protein [Tepidibacillus fermentans]|uniref:CRISPR-associated protein Csh1 n=1 Tax=Tepidibacillus fermentans TaxID=1281767 RepID=A0A4R3K763_9BACI|nr:TM1802 family CRISPR-associated protein [Tepidibacillus fermentans]TCS78786.1 CRISPR-associated protein Csh1 [Tepidibacillus fermentans]
MNLPQITAQIGKHQIQKQRQKQTPLTSLIKKTKIKLKENDKPYALFMTFDLLTQQIKFENPIPYTESLLERYLYLGNNSANSLQSYLVRQVDSLHYLLTSVWNDLYLALIQNELSESELAILLRLLESNTLIKLGTKKGEGRVNLEKIDFLSNDWVIESIDKKTININGKNYNYEQFIHLLFDDQNKQNRYLLIIPKIRTEQNEIILSQHQDYIQLVMKINNLSKSIDDSEKTQKKDEGRICYICNQRKENVSSSYTTKFSRSGINKIFTTTTINSSRDLNKIRYDDAYSICPDCYQDLLAGEGIIQEKFQGMIAGERTFILPEGLFTVFDYENLAKIKDNIDFAFKSSEAKDWLERIEAEADWLEENHYMVNFVIYRTDGNSVTILEVIEDVPVFRFTKIMNLIQQNVSNLKENLKNNHLHVSLDSIYRVIPVKENDKGQVDIGRVLSFYKAILSGHLIERETIFKYFSEALDKGLKQLWKKKIDNYKNLDLFRYLGKEDFFIEKITMTYLILMKTIQQLLILDKPIFQYEQKGESDLDKEKPNFNDSIQTMEKFLEKQGFSRQAKALFYLGTLVNLVALAQYQKEHESKPILRKIQFQGMSPNDILRLYEEVVEKLRQYNKLTLFAELLMNRFHAYYGNLEQKWNLSEHANVFYLMSGYSYMTGTKMLENE